MRARRDPRLSAASSPPLAAIVWSVVAPLSALLPPNSAKPQSRSAFAAVVCAKPSGRGFRRDFRSVAAAALAMADALCRLAGTQETRICRRADAGYRRQTAGGHESRETRSAEHAYANARRLLQKEAVALYRRYAANL